VKWILLNEESVGREVDRVLSDSSCEVNITAPSELSVEWVVSIHDSMLCLLL